MNFTKIILSSLFAVVTMSSTAQQGWTLKECIDYAVKNNISVQKMYLRTEDQAVRVNTAQNSRLPSLGANLGGNLYFGRGPGRDGTYLDHTQLSTSVGLSANIPVFAGFSIKHNIAGAQLDLKAAMQDLERAREDVALNVTSLYLQVLFNEEILKVAESQVELSKGEVSRSEILVASGKNPESQLYESRALLARDELSLTQAQNNYKISILDLSQALNLENVTNFSVRAPQTDDEMANAVATLSTPQRVYDIAVGTRPRILAEEIRLKRSETSLLSARASRYPTVSMSAGYGNSYFYSFVTGYNNKGFIDQLQNNGNQSIGLSINVPIFNRFSIRNQIRTAKIAINTQELTLKETKQSLYKEIEQSYFTAVAAYDKYKSAIASVDAARIAFKYEQEKSEAGKSTIFDFNDAKTRLERSESEMVQAKFEFLFRRKILDFYAGVPLDFTKY